MLNRKIVEILGGSALVASVILSAVDMDQQQTVQVQQSRACCEKHKSDDAAEAAQAVAPEDAWPMKMGGNRPGAQAVVAPTGPDAPPVAEAPPAPDARSISEKGVAPTRNHRVAGQTRPQ